MRRYSWYMKNELRTLTWHALQTYTGREALVQQYIEGNMPGHTPYLPKRRLLERKAGGFRTAEKPLFPGDIFIAGDMDAEACGELRKCSGVIKILRSGDTYADTVKKEEMDFIFDLTGDTDTIEISTAMFDVNDRISIISGPLRSMEMDIKKVDRRRRRVFVEIEIFSEKREISLSYDIVQKANG